MTRYGVWLGIAAIGGALVLQFHLALAPASALNVAECCVCDADCPKDGTRQCFTIMDFDEQAFDSAQTLCSSLCAGIGCSEAPVCVPAAACTELELCSETLNGECNDGIDNNDDGLTDCADPQCSGDPNCRAAAPALSPAALALSALLLLSLGSIWIRHRSPS